MARIRREKEMAFGGLENHMHSEGSRGAGTRDPLDNNKVMSAKIWWRWINYEEEPWAKLLHLKYAPLWPKQSLVHFGENLPGSSIWKAVQENRGLVQKHKFWEVRGG